MPQSNLASRATRPYRAEEAVLMAHSPDVKKTSAAPSRPPYLNAPSLSMSINNCTWRTYSGWLIVSSVSNPSKPFARVASGTSWSAPKFSKCTQVGHSVVKAHDEALVARIRRAASRSWAQVFGGEAGSSPALRKASLLYHSIGVELLNGIPAILPSALL